MKRDYHLKVLLCH